jgi:hypothetical protein
MTNNIIDIHSSYKITLSTNITLRDHKQLPNHNIIKTYKKKEKIK